MPKAQGAPVDPTAAEGRDRPRARPAAGPNATTGRGRSRAFRVWALVFGVQGFRVSGFRV